jgi:hypothetical protein
MRDLGTKGQVRTGGAPGARTQNPLIKRAAVCGPGGSGNVRDLGRVPARHRPDCSELQPELQPRARSLRLRRGRQERPAGAGAGRGVRWPGLRGGCGLLFAAAALDGPLPTPSAHREVHYARDPDWRGVLVYR